MSVGTVVSSRILLPPIKTLAKATIGPAPYSELIVLSRGHRL